MYLFQGFLIGFLPVLVFNAIGLLISRKKNIEKNLKRNIITALIVAVVWGVIVWVTRWGCKSQIYGPAPLFGWIMISILLGSFTSAKERRRSFNFSLFKPGLIVAGMMFLWVAYNGIISGGFLDSSSKKLGKILPVTVKYVNEIDLEPADIKHIALVDEEMAKLKASLALTTIKTPDSIIIGSKYNLGKPIKQSVDSCLWWIFPLEFTGYWQWSPTATIPGYIRVSAEDPALNAQAVQYDKQGKPIAIRYLQSACFHQNAERYLREHGYALANIADFTFEVNDDWQPKLTIDNLEWTVGFTGTTIKSIIVFDVQTGDIQECALADVPNKFPWLDRAVPQDVLDAQCKYWGDYSRAPWAWTSSNDGMRKKPTDGWYLAYDMKCCYWLTGWTSLNDSTHDLIGISITNGQTGKTTYFQTQGFTEVVAYKIAKGLWSQYTAYQPSDAIPYNIYGVMTYVIPMKYGATFEGVSLVSMYDKDINAKGFTLEEAFSNYRISIARGKLKNKEIPSSGQPSTTARLLKGVIDNVGMPIMIGTTQEFPFTLKGVKKIFQVNYSFNNPKAPFIKVGTEVVLTYQDTQESIITLETFDIPAIQLSSENPNQASWVENQKTMNAETRRISNIHDNQDLLKPANLGKMNPDSLKKFIESQTKPKKK